VITEVWFFWWPWSPGNDDPVELGLVEPLRLPFWERWLLCEYAMLLLFLFLFCLNCRTDSTETRGYKSPVPSKYFWSGLEQRAETKTTSYMSINLQAQIDAVAPITPSLTIYSHSLSVNWRCFKPTNLYRSFNFLNNTAIITVSGSVLIVTTKTRSVTAALLVRLDGYD